MKVKAAIFHEPGVPFQIEEVDLAPPQEGEVLVRMVAAGVCHSDWHLMTGATKHALPVVPGHEGAGVVEAVGPGVSRIRVGDHVSLNWAPNCGECFYCLRDRPSLCTTFVDPIWAGTMMDGTTRLTKRGQPLYHFSALACFADRAVVPEASCVPVHKSVPLQVAALIGCAVTTGVGAVLNTAMVPPGSSVAVFGAGGVGLSIIMGAKLAGAGQIIAVDINEAKGDLAQSFGATDVLINSPDVVQDIRRLTEGRGADYVFEAVGIPTVQEQGLAAVRPGGSLVLVGISPMGSSTNLPGAIIARQEKTVTGSYYGTANTARDFPLYADLYRRGKLDLERLITKTYPLEAINEAYADMLSGQVARGVLLFS
ncbi:MAG: Zn-dependent alcohol dehydrogenase [Candidatus Promineifilaceae bacterium]|nr:Zn-dependent alcohol dehydrogenase [Candidatus Promineifilaceae bacterium]